MNTIATNDTIVAMLNEYMDDFCCLFSSSDVEDAKRRIIEFPFDVEVLILESEKLKRIQTWFNEQRTFIAVVGNVGMGAIPNEIAFQDGDSEAVQVYNRQVLLQCFALAYTAALYVHRIGKVMRFRK